MPPSSGCNSQGEVVAAAVTMMVNSGQSVDDLKKTNPETAKIFIQAAVDQALKNGTWPGGRIEAHEPVRGQRIQYRCAGGSQFSREYPRNDSEKQCRAGSGGRIERNTEHRCVHDSRVRARRSPCPACHGRSQCRKEDARGIYPSQRPSQPIGCQRDLTRAPERLQIIADRQNDYMRTGLAEAVPGIPRRRRTI